MQENVPGHFFFHFFFHAAVVRSVLVLSAVRERRGLFRTVEESRDGAVGKSVLRAPRVEWLGDWSRAHTEMRRSSPNSLSSPLAGGSINFQLLEYVLCNRCTGNRSLDEAAEAADRCRTDSYIYTN